MNANDFSDALLLMCMPAIDLDLRSSMLRSFKLFSTSYISGIQGVINSTLESDPIHAEAIAALSEIETTLMDR